MVLSQDCSSESPGQHLKCKVPRSHLDMESGSMGWGLEPSQPYFIKIFQVILLQSKDSELITLRYLEKLQI